MTSRIRSFRPGEDDAAVADLWSRIFGSPVGGQTLEWLFRPGPAGESVRVVAELAGRLVGHAGAFPLRFTLLGTQVRGAYSVAAMTDPSARGLGLYFEMGQHLYEELEAEGFAFVAGFSNASSYRLMTGPLGRTALRPFPWCVKLLNPMPLAAALVGRSPREKPRSVLDTEQHGLRIEACAPDDRRLDELWQSAGPALRVATVRDAAFGQWRFGSRPTAGYRVALACEGGVTLAAAVYRPFTVRGLPAAFLMDLVVTPGREAAAGHLLRRVERAARAEGAAVMSALMPGQGPARSVLRSARYLRVPERLHPQTIRFSVRGFGDFEHRSEILDPRSWTLSWADTDVV